MVKRLLGGAGLAALLAAAAWAQAEPGYLPVTAVDAIAIAGPPPAPGSPEESADITAYRAGAAGAGSERWAQARADDAIDMPTVLKRYACAIDAELTPETAPNTVRLLSRTLADADAISSVAKKHYLRPRPFAADDPATPLCVDIPAERRAKTSTTWPSGHATVGAVWGGVLADVAPSRRAEIAARSRFFIDSRRVCRLHYPSDLAAGERVGKAIHAALAAQPDYAADVRLARAEVAAAPKPKDCSS